MYLERSTKESAIKPNALRVTCLKRLMQKESIAENPARLASAAHLCGDPPDKRRLTQETVSDATSVSKITIRNRYQELFDVIGL